MPVAAMIAVAADTEGLPVEIVDRPRNEDTYPTSDAKLAQSTIEIDISGGHRLRIVDTCDPEALAWLIRGLSG